MIRLYLFPIEEESRDLARQSSEQILEEIKKYYILCRYVEPVDALNISSEVNGTQLVQFEPSLPSAFQVWDNVRPCPHSRDLVSIVTTALNAKGVKHKSPMEFPL